MPFWHLVNENESGSVEMASRHFASFQYTFLMIITCRKMCVLLIMFKRGSRATCCHVWKIQKRGWMGCKKKKKTKCHTICSCFFADSTIHFTRLVWPERNKFYFRAQANWKNSYSVSYCFAFGVKYFLIQLEWINIFFLYYFHKLCTYVRIKSDV